VQKSRSTITRIKSAMNHVVSATEGLNGVLEKRDIFGIFLEVMLPVSGFFYQSHESYNPTVEPLFPGVGRYVAVTVGFRVFVERTAVPEFFIIVGTVVSAVAL